MAKQDESSVVGEARGAEIERVKKRLDLLDERLDNMDSVITAAVERVMSQPVALNITCPHCGRGIEISIIGTLKPRGRP